MKFKIFITALVLGLALPAAALAQDASPVEALPDSEPAGAEPLAPTPESVQTAPEPQPPTSASEWGYDRHRPLH